MNPILPVQNYPVFKLAFSMENPKLAMCYLLRWRYLVRDIAYESEDFTKTMATALSGKVV